MVTNYVVTTNVVSVRTTWCWLRTNSSCRPELVRQETALTIHSGRRVAQGQLKAMQQRQSKFDSEDE